MTWFVDHRIAFPTCISPREVRLYDDFMQWETHIKQRWQEFLDPNLVTHLHLVIPGPPALEPGIAAHVILIQAPRAEWASSLVTVDDPIMNALNDGIPMRLVITTPVQIRPAHIAQACGYNPTCFQRNGPAHCYAMIEAQILAHDQIWPGRSGLSIEFHVNRLQRHRPNSGTLHSPGLQLLHRRKRNGGVPDLMPSGFVEVQHNPCSEPAPCFGRSVWTIVSPESIPVPTFLDRC